MNKETEQIDAVLKRVQERARKIYILKLENIKDRELIESLEKST